MSHLSYEIGGDQALMTAPPGIARAKCRNVRAFCARIGEKSVPEVAKGADVSRCATACPDSLKNPVVCATENPSLVTSSAMTRSQWFSADTSRDTSRQYQSAQTFSFLDEQ